MDSRLNEFFKGCVPRCCVLLMLSIQSPYKMSKKLILKPGLKTLSTLGHAGYCGIKHRNEFGGGVALIALTANGSLDHQLMQIGGVIPATGIGRVVIRDNHMSPLT